MNNTRRKATSKDCHKDQDQTGVIDSFAFHAYLHACWSRFGIAFLGGKDLTNVYDFWHL